MSVVADWRRFVETSWSAQMAGLDVVAAQYGTGRFIPDACGPARPVLAACRACEAGLRGRESSVLRDGRARRAGVKYAADRFADNQNFALRCPFGT